MAHIAPNQTTRRIILRQQEKIHLVQTTAYLDQTLQKGLTLKPVKATTQYTPPHKPMA
jgi:hypothetical protein